MGAPEPTATPRAFCIHCGNPNPPGAVFCSRCGTRIGPGSDTAPFPTTASSGTYTPVPWGPPSGPTALPYARSSGVPPEIARDRERTGIGLLLMIIGLAIGWVPYVGALGGLLALIGVIVLFLGRRAYGPDHQRNVVVGGVLLLVGLIAGIVVAVAVVGAVVSSVTASSGSPSQLGSALEQELIAVFVAATVLGVLGAIAEVILPYALADRTTRILLWTGFATSVAVSVLTLWVLLPLLSSAISQATSGTSFDVGPINQLELTENILRLAGAVPALFFTWGYYRARQEARRRDGLPV